MEMRQQGRQDPFQSIIGQDKVLEELQLIFRHMNLEKRESPFLMLFYGTSGTGKSSVAESLSKLHGFNYYVLESTAFMSRYQAESEKQLKQIFKEAEENGPSIILLDECEVLLGGIRDCDNSSMQNCKNLLLQIFSGHLQPKGVAIICCTNRYFS